MYSHLGFNRPGLCVCFFLQHYVYLFIFFFILQLSDTYNCSLQLFFTYISSSVGMFVCIYIFLKSIIGTGLVVDRWFSFTRFTCSLEIKYCFNSILHNPILRKKFKNSMELILPCQITIFSDQ